MYKKAVVGCLAALFASIAIAATEPAGRSKGDEMAAAKCASILDLFAAADPQGAKDKKALAAAQDRAYLFVMWVHGFLSGRDGIDFAKRPLNQEGVTQVVSDIYQVCKDDESKNFLDAVKNIR